MILYQVITSYHLLSAIVHRIKNHDKNECILILSNWLTKKYPQYEQLEIFFKKVLVLDIARGCDFTTAEYPSGVDEYILSFFETNDLNLDIFSEINMMGAQYNLGFYLERHGIPFTFWEESSGIITQKSVLENIISELSGANKAEYCSKIGFFDGTAKCIKQRVFDFEAQYGFFSSKNAIDFCVTREFISLDEGNQTRIRSIFNSDFTIDVPDDCVLLLTQHFANLKILSFDDQILIYQLVMDYFFENRNVVFKPHPEDLLYYSQLFENSTVIHQRFPSEFLPVMFSNKPSTIATISSTAINNLRSYFDGNFELGYRFEKDFRAIHRYYVALRLYEVFGKNMCIETVGADEQLLLELMNVGGIAENRGGICYIVDDISTQDEYDSGRIIKLVENLPDDSAVVFINSKQDYCFYDIEHKALWSNIVPICINKECIREDEFHDDVQTEVIYLFSKNERVLEMGRNYVYEKTLKNTGEKISIMQLTPDQERIKVLEGILEATETRLLYYMDLLDEKREGNK